MNQLTLFHDPVFLLTWQVHIVIAILFSLLGVWMGARGRPWYLGPILCCGLLWLFVPLEAPEPVIVLLIFVPLLAGGIFAIRSLGTRTVTEKKPAPFRWRFGLADLLWFTLLVGLVTSLLLQCLRMPWQMRWPDLLLSGVCFWLIGIAAFLANGPLARKRPSVLAIVIAILLLVASGLHYWLDDALYLLMYGENSYIWDKLVNLRFGADPQRLDLFLFYLISFTEFFALIALLGSWQSTLRLSKRRSWSTSFLLARTTIFAFLVLAMGFIYVAMFNRPTWPVEQWPEKNERDALLALLERSELQHPRRQLWKDVAAPNGKSYSQSVLRLFEELDALLQRDQISMFDSRTDRPHYGKLSEPYGSVSRLGYALYAQTKADWAEGRNDEAVQHSILSMRLGRTLQYRGTFFGIVTASVVEANAQHHLAKHRSELNCLQIQRLESFLKCLATSAVSPESIIQHELVFNEKAGGWRERLHNIMRSLTGIDVSEHQNDFVFILSHRDVRLALLRTDLAIRCYQQTHGRWPDRLEDLVPEAFESLPLDPFSNRPLVYRKSGESFLLYSVGQDGIDDGGDFEGVPIDQKDVHLD